MPKKIVLTTGPSKASVSAFIASIEDAKKRKDAKTLLALFKEVTGKPAVLWGGAMVGFGTYDYKRSNGDYGTYFATGFSPRKGDLTIYILPGYQNYGAMLAKLGKHKLGKSCLYLKSLDGIDLEVLRKLIKTGLADLAKTHTVQ